ncbi:alpha/beta hydrolase [Prolixibacteraceae bacterium Z1-6]|uniref:Alpha/beta hydrolase n=1 Tax=Draconibacterium aestuarii TaxID=2998507 RepID=A0A9X3F834_9BACT|nr:alpha/beta hydrolase [Prolixibacteraceae bacterium Z1-6]
MKRIIVLLFITVFLFEISHAGIRESKPLVYLIPGQGSDARLYKNLEIDSTFEVRYIAYFLPEKEWSMNDFARELAKQIDTTRRFSIIGVSLGGMVATEMTDFLEPEKVIVISSAKNRKEFPFRYRFQKDLPVYKIVPAPIVKMGARILQPLVEPDRNKDKDTFISMLKSKDSKFLRRTVKMIIEWQRIENDETIIHIHGDNDHTLPARNVYFDYLVEGGSHMMVLTKGKLISDLVNQELIKVP